MRKFVVVFFFFPCVVSSERRDTAVRRQHQQKHKTPPPQKARRRREHRRRRRRLHSKRAADDDDGKEMNQSINQSRERDEREKSVMQMSSLDFRLLSSSLSNTKSLSLSLFSPLRVRLEPSSSSSLFGERRQHRVVVLVAIEGRAK